LRFEPFIGEIDAATVSDLVDSIGRMQGVIRLSIERLRRRRQWEPGSSARYKGKNNKEVNHGGFSRRKTNRYWPLP
jgi:hypothetical protein